MLGAESQRASSSATRKHVHGRVPGSAAKSLNLTEACPAGHPWRGVCGLRAPAPALHSPGHPNAGAIGVKFGIETGGSRRLTWINQ